MPLDEMITQCPSCATSFKVTEAQLRAADGAVRCGACLQIFQAADYVLNNTVVDNTDLNNTIFNKTAVVLDAVPVVAQEDTVPASQNEIARESVDDSATKTAYYESDEGLIVDSDNDSEETLAESAKDELVDEYQEVPENESAEYASYDVVGESDEGRGDSFEDGVASETEEGTAADTDHKIPDESKEQIAESELPQKSEEPLLSDAEGSLISDAEGSSGEIVDDQKGYIDRDSLQGRPGEIHLDDELDIVGEYVPPVISRTRRLILPVVVLLFLLIIQFAWFNKEILSQHAQLRSYYEYTCNVIDCNLPHYSNSKLLSVSGLVVRTHPVTERALKVDAILRNDGLFKQRFPRLQLRFTNINDQTIASRNFNPDEYLKGELTGLKFIPANTEVRLALEIVDPDAIGYSLMIIPD
ncbi:MAG: putative Zn finger-like uncharacterized protein [Candidatus Azotimanducaceae bacterium]|jgi:predicted Zn finger-like uncharacterized protein